MLKYAGAIGDPFEVGKTLRVDAVLEGRVQQVDKRLRVTVQLLSAREGKQLWAETFDDYFTNIFAVQDTISEKVASALSLDLGGSDRPAGSRRSTENTEAYRLYLQGQYLASKRLHEATLATFRRKIEGLNRVDSEAAGGGWCMNVLTKHFRAELL